MKPSAITIPAGLQLAVVSTQTRTHHTSQHLRFTDEEKALCGKGSVVNVAKTSMTGNFCQSCRKALPAARKKLREQMAERKGIASAFSSSQLANVEAMNHVGFGLEYLGESVYRVGARGRFAGDSGHDVFIAFDNDGRFEGVFTRAREQPAEAPAATEEVGRCGTCNDTGMVCDVCGEAEGICTCDMPGLHECEDCTKDGE